MRVRKIVHGFVYFAVVIAVFGVDILFSEETAPGSSQMGDSMYSIFVIINVKPEHRETFVKASTVEARGTISGEPGVYQFHMLADETNPNRFYFFEIFRDEEAVKTHWETENFKIWWDTVEEMIDGDTELVSTMRTIFPSVKGLEKQKPGLMN